MWQEKYTEWNTHNLESYGVMDVMNMPYVLVHKSHPVIDMLRSNADILGCDIDEQPMIDKQCFRVSRQVLAACCDTLRRILSSEDCAEQPIARLLEG